MNKGYVFSIATGKRGFYASLFRLFHLSIVTSTKPNYATTLMIGFYRFEYATTLTVRRNVMWEESERGFA